ncbi:site-2 protease family protein [Patescibacteria group bacterium]|nr:site-2 protease family protein [Patescibacteria group bacterium]MDE1946561.1 site-2 protease family protein [Patescibacteria group bacterium]MDE2010878.1 site-2 protease family protein [Patescibacteria group bacterium]MDE2232762.1 site-2 protease family protein [Patescibacteria group bacterium]
MTTAIIFIVVLAVLIFVHELGHFLAARACGIRVDAFKIGFGPKIFSWQKGETEYGVNAIPFGGYVKIFGENPDGESISGPDSPRSFVNKPRWQQAIVLFAGVFFNFLFAWLLYSIVFAGGVTAATDGFEQYAGRFHNERIMITYVEPGSPAEKAGIATGDTIDQVLMADGGLPVVDNLNTGTVSNGKISDIQNLINGSGVSPVSIEYSTIGNVTKTVMVTPVKGIVEGKYAIGIAMQTVADFSLPLPTAIYEGAHYTAVLVKETAIGLYAFIANIFRGTPNFSDVAGPVGIAGIVGNAAEMGFKYLLMVTAIISLNLGVINLIPFPALDGGRILFVGLEGISRRRIPPKFANTVNAIGFALLILLMVAVTYKDIAKLFM